MYNFCSFCFASDGTEDRHKDHKYIFEHWYYKQKIYKMQRITNSKEMVRKTATSWHLKCKFNLKLFRDAVYVKGWMQGHHQYSQQASSLLQAGQLSSLLTCWISRHRRPSSRSTSHTDSPSGPDWTGTEHLCQLWHTSHPRGEGE